MMHLCAVVFVLVNEVVATTLDKAGGQLRGTSSLDKILGREVTLQCCTLVQEQNLQPLQSWGSSTEEQRSWWGSTGCDFIVGGTGAPHCKGVVSIKAPVTKKASFEAKQLPVVALAAEKMSDTKGLPLPKCCALALQGPLDEAEQKWWSSHDCSIITQGKGAPACQSFMSQKQLCCSIVEAYGVSPKQSWGQAETKQKQDWYDFHCDATVGGTDAPECHHSVPPTPTVTESHISQLYVKPCCDLVKNFGVRPEESFGSLSDEDKVWWVENGCVDEVGGQGAPKC
eukprot:TRINITY_DN70392_c0_g1_i1.p1 TRINITY_DN70392_c0_g1~~TRINITY_DN70392_c0_g1_i1.p1  ORF type:complete len:299 (+),score=50.39 TRINITY_DN70392_c0_g1_i1:46-897(+)